MVFSTVLKDSWVWALETIFIEKQLKIITGDNESNLIILQDDTATFKLENVKSQNEDKIAKEKL